MVTVEEWVVADSVACIVALVYFSIGIGSGRCGDCFGVFVSRRCVVGGGSRCCGDAACVLMFVIGVGGLA